jgi:hypothetical protein
MTGYLAPESVRKHVGVITIMLFAEELTPELRAGVEGGVE